MATNRQRVCRTRAVARRFAQGRPSRQRGAALIIGLVLLMVLTVLTVSGMRAATLEITMAGNVQFAQNAFQAAETGIERAMAGVELTTVVQLADHDLPESDDAAQTTTSWVGASATLSGGTSLGAGFAAHHFEIVSVGRATRGATSTHTQGFFVVGPDGS